MCVCVYILYTVYVREKKKNIWMLVYDLNKKHEKYFNGQFDSHSHVILHTLGPTAAALW